MTAEVWRSLQDMEPRVRAVAEDRGARLEITSLGREGTAEESLLAPLQTVLLALATHAVPEGTMRIMSTDRAGGDTEIIIEGIDLPDDIDTEGPFADLWSFAVQFLGDIHRARVAHHRTRVTILLPAAVRARKLRGAAN